MVRLLLALSIVLAPAACAQGFEVLFGGESAAAFRGYRKPGFPATGWAIEDGTLHHIPGGGGGDIVTRETFADFDLRFEWKVAPRANSGVMYRVAESAGSTYETGPEYQVLDDPGYGADLDPKTAASSLYGLVAREKSPLKPAGEFNRGRILVVENVAEHWLNDVRVLRYRLQSDEIRSLIRGTKFEAMPGFAEQPSGHIAFQDHGDAVWYRNIRILRIPSGGRVDLFRRGGFDDAVFHVDGGGDPKDTWLLADGVLVCKGSPAGYIRTAAKYRDFLLRLEWRWCPEKRSGGNSGVLLRVTGEDRVWPRSIEGQLMSGNAGDFWNIGDVPMLTDPRRKSGRNTRKIAHAENPVGQWNEYEILCAGGLVELRVNGVLVNRAYDAERVPGYVALQSEGAEIHFRNVVLHPLGDG